MKATIYILKKRISEYSKKGKVKLQDNQIILEVPKADNIDEDTIEKIVSQGYLKITNEDGMVLIEGDSIEKAKAIEDNSNGGYQVSLQFDIHGTKLLEKYTSEYIGKKFDIYYDYDLLESTTVNEKISNGNVLISGIDTKEKADEIAFLINSGSFPFELEVMNIE